MNDKNNPIQLGFQKRKQRWLFLTALLCMVTLVLSLVALMSGNTFYPIDVVIKVLLGEDIQGATFAIATLRLPRMLAGLLVGLSFGIAGSTFQTMLRNPLASPDIIGVTSGSSVAAVFCILVLKTSGFVVSFSAVVTGLCVALLIYMLSRGGQFSGGRLILIGIGVQAMLNSVISYLMLKASQYDIPSAMRWLSGSLNGLRLSHIPSLAIVTLLFGLMILLLSRQLKILELGEQSALTLGLRPDRIRILLVLSSVFLIAFATAVTGPISFVAFLSGPIAKRMVGPGQSIQLPAGFVGASLVLLADTLGQFAFDTRFPVGVITGILGAPYLLFLLVRMNQNGGTA